MGRQTASQACNALADLARDVPERQIATAPETVLGLLLNRRPANRARGYGDVAFRVRINARAHHTVSEGSSDGETLRWLIGASAAQSIGDPDLHDPTIPIETRIGRPRRDRAGIKGSVFDGR
jgi:hypothetical protein